MTPLLATVLLDPPTTLLFGAVLAVVSGKLIRVKPEEELKKTAILAAVWSAWYGLCVAWFFFARTDWMLVYLTDAQKVPLVPAFVFFLMVLVVHGAAGALAAGALVQLGKTRLALAFAIGAILAWAGLTALQSDAYAHLGTFDQYVKGAAPMLETDSTMKVAMAISGAASAIPAFGLLFVRFRKARAA